MTQRFTNPLSKFTTDVLQIIPYATLSFFANGSSTPKAVYADKSKVTSLGTVVTADSAGNFPPIWLDGTYRATLKSKSTTITDNPATGVTQTGWPIDSIGDNQNFTSFSAWDATFTYDITTNSFVTGSNGLYYQSIQNPNFNKDPISNPSYWQQIYFLPQWNSTISYAVGALVIYGGLLYRSSALPNIGNTPPSSQWDNVSFNASITGPFTASGAITGGSFVTAAGLTCATVTASGVITAASFVGIGVAATAKKTVATNRISTTTLSADPDLITASLAIGVYAFKCVINWQGQGSTTNGIKAQVRCATGTTLTQAAIATANTVAANAAPTANDLIDLGAAFSKLPNYSGGKETLILEGVINVTSAGAIFLEWSQAASVATNTTVIAGYLTAIKL